jgi:hypothetical protein
MGFRLPNTLITIDFPAGHELHGLEVHAGSVPFGTYLELAGLANTAFGSGQESIAALGKLVEGFAVNALRGWNLEDDHGAPVPCTFEQLCKLNARHALAVITAWLSAAGGEVPAPLGQPSSGGVPSVVELPPMELPSGSPAS